MLQDVGEDRPLLSGSSSSSTSSLPASPQLAGVETIHDSSNKPPRSSSSSSSADEEIGLVSDPIGRTIEATVLPETSHLGRHLSWHSAFIIVISRVIGSGIFATPGAVVRSAGSIGLSLTIWTAGAVLAACGLGVSLELGCMLPRSGGDKVYLEFIYRRPRFLASTLVAVNAVLLGFTASNCVVFSEYVLFAFGMDQPSDLLRKGLAVGLLTAITVVHGCTPKIGVAVQNVLGWFKVGLVVFMVFAGLFVVIFNPGQSDTRNGRGDLLNWDELWKDSDWSWGTIATSLFKVFYSYAGLSNMNNVLNDVKDPVRTYKSVSMSALVTALLLYTLVNIAYFIVVPLEEIKNSGELIAALFFERTFGPNLGRKILPLAVAVSAGGNVMVVTYALVRRLLRAEVSLLLTAVTGPPQPGDRPARIPSMAGTPCIDETIQCAARWPHRTLHPVVAGDCPSTVQPGLLVHSRSGRVPSAVLLAGCFGWLAVAPLQTAGPEKTIQGLDWCRGVTHGRELSPCYRAVLPSGTLHGDHFLRYVCPCGHCYVRPNLFASV